jgi:MFS family permease
MTTVPRFALLRRRGVRLYLSALAPSLFGDSAMLLVAGVWAKELTGSSGTAALVTFALWAPALAGPLLGALADRFRRLPLLIAVDAVMAGWVLLLLGVRGAGGLWLLFVVVVGYGVAYAVVEPAEGALFPALVDAEELAALNGVRVGLQESCKLLAPATGAALFAWWGPHPVVVLDAVSFAVAAVVLVRLRASGDVREARPVPGSGPWAGLGAGVRHLVGTAGLRRTLTGCAAGMFALGLAVSMTFAVIDEGLHRSPAFLGVISPVLGASSVAGGGLAPVALRLWGERRAAAAGLALLGAAVGVTAVPWLPAVLAGSVLRGLGAPAVTVAAVTLVQRRTPDEVRGRTLAAAGTLLNVPVTAGLGLGAALLAWVDYRVVLVGCAALCGGAALATGRAAAGVEGVAADGAVADEASSGLRGR